MTAFLVNPRRARFLALSVSALAVLFALGTARPAQAQADALCTKVCAQLVQAIGDDIKEQIPLDCVQQTGRCTGTGYFQTGDGNRVPVTVEGGLTSPNTLSLQLYSGTGKFAPTDAEALVLDLQPDMPYQTGRFVVAQKVADAPFAQSGTSLSVTVIVQRLM